MIFRDLWFDQEDDVFNDYRVVNEKGEEGNYLPQLSRVNIFIGPNNSGKSRFHRELFKNLGGLNPINGMGQNDASSSQSPTSLGKIDSSVHDISNTSQRINNITKRLNTYLTQNTFGPNVEADFASTLKDFNTFFQGSPRTTRYQSLQNLEDKLIELKNAFMLSDLSELLTVSGDVKNTLDLIEAAQKSLSESGKVFFETSTETTYCPPTRTLKRLSEQNALRKRFRNDYFADVEELNPENGSYIFTGETIFEDLRSLLLGGIDDIQNVLDFSKFLGSTFYNGMSFSLSAADLQKGEDGAVMSGILKVKIGDDPEMRITKLGDGIQAIIALSFPLYTKGNSKHLLFIDEPEQNLHPGFQRIFMETLLQDRFKDTQVFICTHSNHFLDMSLDYPEDISIYSFQKKFEQEDGKKSFFEIRHRAGKDKEVLQMIGARNSSVFLSNCTIWVEGITDRLYLRTWLEIYQEMIRIENSENKKYHEDIHYSFVEFGGANITHWSFLDQEEGIGVEALCGPVLVIADRDDISKADSAKARRHIKLKESLGNDYAMIERREVENILLPTQITQAARKVFGNDEIKDAQLIFSAYEKAYLGSFLDKQVGLKKTDEPIFASKSGTIKNKVKFCRAVVDNLKIEMGKAEKKEELKALLLPDGKTEDDNKLDTPYHLAKRAYEFIKEHN